MILYRYLSNLTILSYALSNLMKLSKMWTTQGCCVLFWTNTGGHILYNNSSTGQEKHLSNHPGEKERYTGEVRTKSSVMTFFHGLLHIDTSVMVNQQKCTSISSIQRRSAVLKTYQVRWLVYRERKRERERERERETKGSVLLTRIEDKGTMIETVINDNL